MGRGGCLGTGSGRPAAPLPESPPDLYLHHTHTHIEEMRSS